MDSCFDRSVLMAIIMGHCVLVGYCVAARGALQWGQRALHVQDDVFGFQQFESVV